MDYLYNLLETMELKKSYSAAVKRKSLELVPASSRGENHCCRSGFCCWRAPGELTPDDLTRLAAHAGLSEGEFFRANCVVDTHVRDHALVVRLRREHQRGGEMTAYRETYSVESPCVFLTDSGCAVHAVKPDCCRNYECWNEVGAEVAADRMHRWDRAAILALGWDGVNPDEE